MKEELAWRAVGRDELAALLGAAPPLASAAVGAATVYRIENDGREMLAIALPGGTAIVVERPPAARRRRRIDAKKVSPVFR